LKKILQLTDRDVDDQRAHIAPYLAPYLNFLLTNLESLAQNAPELLTVLEEPPTTNGALLASGTGHHAMSGSNPDPNTPTLSEKDGKLVKQWPDLWFRLLIEMVDILSYEAEADQRGPELNAIRERLTGKGILKAGVDVQGAAQLILRVFGWLTMLFEPPLDYQESERNSFSPTKDSSKVPQPGLRKANTWTPHPITLTFYDERPIVDALYHMLKENPFPQPLTAPSNPLKGSNLSYYTLSKLAGLRIQWTESLGRHLELNKSSRTLKLFRFPSFCMLLCLGASERTFIQR
jgi:hypothetical protein